MNSYNYWLNYYKTNFKYLCDLFKKDYILGLIEWLDHFKKNVQNNINQIRAIETILDSV